MAGHRIHGLVIALLATSFRTGPATAYGQAAAAAPAVAVESLEALGEEANSTPFAIDGKSDVMMELLSWATKHSDPERLKEIMAKYADNNLTIMDVYGKDVLDAMFVDEASEMKQAIRQIADFRNGSVADEDLEDSLERLRDFVEQVDNAMNLHRMGGLQPLLDLSTASDRRPSVHSQALWTVGVAVQNNEPVQAELLGLSGLGRLVSQLPRCAEAASFQYCAKLLFALSSLIRNNEAAQLEADSLGLLEWLVGEGLAHSSLAVAKKSFGMLESILAQSPELPFLDGLTTRPELPQTILRFMALETFDADCIEKGLRLVSRLLNIRPMLFEDSFRQQLDATVSDALQRCESAADDGDFCKDMAELAKQADSILAARDVADDEL